MTLRKTIADNNVKYIIKLTNPLCRRRKRMQTRSRHNQHRQQNIFKKVYMLKGLVVINGKVSNFPLLKTVELKSQEKKLFFLRKNTVPINNQRKRGLQETSEVKSANSLKIFSLNRQKELGEEMEDGCKV